jgi:tRNA U38,U39,U40 pseudouridine synthase TruA
MTSNEGAPATVSARRLKIASIFLWVLLYVLVLAALAGLRSHIFYQPIEHDEAIFLYGGQVWAEGGLPYRDFWDHKPPHVFLFHSLPLRLFPFSRTAVLVHELLWLALAATLFAAVCRVYLSRLATFAGLVFFCLFVSYRQTIRSGGLTEESSLAFVALSYLMILRPSPRVALRAFLAGLSLGMAAEFRQTYAPSLLFLTLAALWQARRPGMTRWKTVGAVVLVGAGFALPEMFWSAFFAAHGAWREYIEASYLFNFRYVGARPEDAGWRAALAAYLKILFDTGPVLAAPLLAIALAPWLPRLRRPILWLALAAFVCEFLPISISGEYYHHYYIQATVSSCLLLALAAEGVRTVALGLAGRTSEGGRGVLKHAAGAVVALGVLALAGWFTVGGIQAYIDGYRTVLKRADRELEEQHSIGQAVAALTGPNDRIQLLGVQPNAVYFVARRHAASRYFHNAPFFKAKFQANITPAMRRRFEDDLRRRPPALVILGPLEGAMEPAQGTAIFDQRPAAAFLKPWLEANYVALADYPKEWNWYGEGEKATFWVRRGK